jgi:hypothetical protein
VPVVGREAKIERVGAGREGANFVHRRQEPSQA